MSMSLDELIPYIKKTLPQPRAIQHLKRNEAAGIATFGWNGHEYVVKPSLEVFQLKNKRLFITGASTLIQLVLMGKTRKEKVIEETLEVLRQIEDQVENPMTREKSLQQLRSVKRTIKSLM